MLADLLPMVVQEEDNVLKVTLHAAIAVVIQLGLEYMSRIESLEGHFLPLTGESDRNFGYWSDARDGVTDVSRCAFDAWKDRSDAVPIKDSLGLRTWTSDIYLDIEPLIALVITRSSLDKELDDVRNLP